MSTFNIRDLYYDFYEYIYFKSIEYDFEKKFYNNMNLITSIVLCLVVFNLIYGYINKYQVTDLYGYNTESINETQDDETPDDNQPNHRLNDSILNDYEDESSDNDSDNSEDSKLYNLFAHLTNKQLLRIVGNKKRRMNKKELVSIAISKFKKRMIRDALYQYPYFNFHARIYLAKNEKEIVREIEFFDKKFN